MSLIQGDAVFLLWGAVLALVGFGFWVEQHTRIGRNLTGIIVAMTVTILLANVWVLPHESPVYDSIFEYILPLAIPLLLFRTDLLEALRKGGGTLAAFAIGSVGVVLGTLLATSLIPLGDISAVAAGLFTATYTGGSANFAAVAIATEYSQGAQLTSMVAADILVTNLQTIVLVALPGIALVRHWFSVGPDVEPNVSVDESAVVAVDGPQAPQPEAKPPAFSVARLNLFGMTLALAVAALLVAAGNFTAEQIGNQSLGIVFTTVYALLISNFLKPLVRQMSGDFEIGIFLIFLFLIAIAAGADLGTLAASGPTFFYFAGIILAVHTLFILVVGRLFRIDLRAIVIGSTACVGGVTTASAIASARGWKHLIIPGIMAGTIGNSVGTFLGVWMWSWMS